MKTKRYSLSYWIKHALRHQSNPEQEIVNLVKAHHADPESTPVSFQGSAHDLLNAAYIEHRKRMGSVHLCLFPTPMSAARLVAETLDIRPYHTVFDPCAGTANLLAAAAERGATAHGLEFQWWLPDMLSTIGFEVRRGDFLDGTPPLPPFDIVMVNPPFGRIGESSDAATDFMARIADISKPNTIVAAILPDGHFERGPKKRMAVIERFNTRKIIPLPKDTFHPLTKISTSIHILDNVAA